MSMESRTCLITIYPMNLKVMFTGLAAQQGQVEVELLTESGYLVGIQQLIGKEIPVHSGHPFHFIGAIPKPGQKPGKVKTGGQSKSRPRGNRNQQSGRGKKKSNRSRKSNTSNNNSSRRQSPNSSSRRKNRSNRSNN